MRTLVLVLAALALSGCLGRTSTIFKTSTVPCPNSIPNVECPDLLNPAGKTRELAREEVELVHEQCKVAVRVLKAGIQDCLKDLKE